MARLSVSLLGPFQVTLDDRPIAAFETDKDPALLAYLAADCDHPQRREALAELLWPDRPEGVARANLRHTLAILRRAIGDRERAATQAGPYLLVDRETVQFSLASDAWVDLAEFADLTGLQDLSGLERAVALYRGPFLDGLTLPDSAAFEEWVLVMRERLQRQAMEALQRLNAHYAQRGEYERAVAHARRQVELEPWEEQAQRELMRLLALSGQRSAALAQYEACVRALKEELDVEPAADTTRLLEQIRHGTLASPTPAAPTATLARGDAADAGLLTWIVAKSGPRHNLPASVTSFIGRERELAELSRLLADPAARLVTVVGAGGMGKTRLALEAARAALESYVETWLVELAPIIDGAAVPRAVAAALGMHEQPDRPLPETIAGALQGRELLLVMDNCEHLVDGAAQLAALLLSRCPQLTVLAISREPLHVPGEHLYEVPPMALPASSDPAGQLLDADAVQLFCRRAAEVRPGFVLDASSAPLAAELCRRLDGMPLAIELAAARLRALSLAEVARRLDDRFRLLTGGSRTALPRQQTLHNTVEWSYDLLGVAEQTLFDCLSVFAGSFSLAAAEAVCSGDGVRKEGVLDLLTALVGSLAGQSGGGHRRHGALPPAGDLARLRAGALERTGRS